MYMKVIKNQEQYAAALSRLDVLMDAAAGSEEADELELLALLINAYEAQAFAHEVPTALEAIRFRMEQMSMRQEDLVPYIGSRRSVREVLSGRRPLTVGMIRALHQGLGIPAEALLR